MIFQSYRQDDDRPSADPPADVDVAMEDVSPNVDAPPDVVVPGDVDAATESYDCPATVQVEAMDVDEDDEVKMDEPMQTADRSVGSL